MRTSFASLYTRQGIVHKKRSTVSIAAAAWNSEQLNGPVESP